MPYKTRISTIQAGLRRKRIDAVLISQPQNRRYLSGYRLDDHGIAETSGILLILKKGSPYLLTDFRFREQAEQQAKGFEILLYPKGIIPLLQKLLVELGIKSLAFESAYTLHSTAEKLNQLGKKLSIDMVPVTGLVENLRRIKSDSEIELLKRSVRLNEEVFQSVYSSIKGDETEIDIALKIAATMRQKGAEGESFETIVATAAASSLPHAVPTSRKLEKNRPLLIDMGLVLNGYCSDMTRTLCLGKADKKYKEIHRIVRKAQLAGIQGVRAGVTAKAVDSAARKVIVDSGYGKQFGHALGHGVGMAVHEEPRISPKSRKKLQAGMVITIEPGIYIPGWGGVRLENMVVVKEDGCEDLNKDTTWLDI